MPGSTYEDAVKGLEGRGLSAEVLANARGRIARTNQMEEILNRIDGKSSTRKEYVDKVVELANNYIKKNADALVQLKTLRECTPAKSEEINALFKANPDLVKARASVALKLALTDGEDVMQYADLADKKDPLISAVKAKLTPVTVPDEAKAKEALHADCIEIVHAEYARYANSLTRSTPPTTPVISTSNVTESQAFRGRLGIQSCDDLADSGWGDHSIDGARIYNVLPGTTAEKMGLRIGDVIVSYNGRKITRQSDLDAEIGKSSPGDKPNLMVMRDGLPFLPSASPLTKTENYHGLGIDISQRDWAGMFGGEGINVDNINPASSLVGNLKRGDVIIQIGNTRTLDMDTFKSAYGIAIQDFLSKKIPLTVGLLDRRSITIYPKGYSPLPEGAIVSDLLGVTTLIDGHIQI